MWQEFKAFLIKQNALALALAVVIGGALDKVVKSLVDGFIMPLVAAVTPDPKLWETATLDLGPLNFKIGIIISAIINFFIIGLVAWRLSKMFIRPGPEKPPTKTCPFCQMTDLDVKAVRCPHCTSALTESPSLPTSPGIPSPSVAR
jgi:large conductance mechanosensitive channel